MNSHACAFPAVKRAIEFHWVGFKGAVPRLIAVALDIEGSVVNERTVQHFDGDLDQVLVTAVHRDLRLKGSNAGPALLEEQGPALLRGGDTAQHDEPGIPLRSGPGLAEPI